MKHNQKVSVKNLNEKQTRINKVINKHKKRNDARNKKWDEKAAKKVEKKK